MPFEIGKKLTHEEKCRINLKRLITNAAEVEDLVPLDGVLNLIDQKTSIAKFISAESKESGLSRADIVWSAMLRHLSADTWEFRDKIVFERNRVRLAARRVPFYDAMDFIG